MLRKGLAVFCILVVVMCGLAGCGKKDAEQEAESAAESSQQSVEPGEMVFIPAGEFIMGTDDKNSDSYPQRKVYLPAFWIDKYEVTNFEFQGFSIEHRYAGEGVAEGKDWRTFVTLDKAMFPIQYITYKDAETYCKSKGKRLPTEEEWEKAARGPNGNAYPWGNEWQDNRSNTAESGPLKPVAVGQYDDVSYYGVHDMLGNVREWTDSWWVMYPGNKKQDPNSGKKTHRIIRGLSPNHRGKVAHLWDRSGMVPSYVGDVGCRCAKDATPEDIAKFSEAK